jgi:hypothetical protein
MENAVTSLRKEYGSYKGDFEEFFHELTNYVISNGNIPLDKIHSKIKKVA